MDVVGGRQGDVIRQKQSIEGPVVRLAVYGAHMPQCGECEMCYAMQSLLRMEILMKTMAIIIAIVIGFSLAWPSFIPSVAGSQEVAADIGAGCSRCKSYSCEVQCEGSTYGACVEDLSSVVICTEESDWSYGCGRGPLPINCPTTKCEDKMP